MSHNGTPYSPDYSTARRRILAACKRQGLTLVEFRHAVRSPSGDELWTDVARLGSADAERLVVLSSGLHGVEGFFGSAVQLAVLDAFENAKIVLPDGVAVVMIHALNPWGFAWLRRTDSHNIDSNRNFLLDGERYDGCSEGYRQLNALLNPPAPPARFELFQLRAAWHVLRQGLPAVKQAVAGGQYEYDKGLFFGGFTPGAVKQMLAAELAEWIGAARRVVHFDFHTGLGTWATYKLLFDYEPKQTEYDWLAGRFGTERLGGMDSGGVAYESRGGIGRWLRAQLPDIEYLPLCAEFGTYSPLSVLRALRAENQAHHWSRSPVNHDHWTKRAIVEAFCPADPRWRERCLSQAVALVEQGINSLS
ncbi:MAG: M14 family metallopeptidase [Pirellulales bacterium]|nr:M14 family metallopeptidase [Pirellulales bacterium]